MKKLAALIAALVATLQLALVVEPALAAPAGGYDAYDSRPVAAGGLRTVRTESWVEEWDVETGQWVRVDGPAGEVARYEGRDLPAITTTYVSGVVTAQTRTPGHEAARYSRPAPPRARAPMLGRYGPFIVTSPTRAAIVGATDSLSPHQFNAMLRDFPHLAVLEMVEAPGTSNDIANLAVGRQIRQAGIATHVPRGGSVRSGAVELFLAGSTKTIADGAQFAVHSWLDNHGREANDFAADDPTHRLYIDYYVEMGMSERRARDFYAMTNSVPHASALWLVADDMRYWIRPEERRQDRPAVNTDFGPVVTRIARATTGLERDMSDRYKRSEPALVLIAYSDLTRTALEELAPVRAMAQLAQARPEALRLGALRLDALHLDALHLDSGVAFP
ncbi:MAG: hypothetical protein AAF697_10430 [Pseudomonadota bacterium]